MRTPDGLHVVHIVCLDIRMILPPVGTEGPVYWFRGKASSPENKRDAANRAGPDPRKKRGP